MANLTQKQTAQLDQALGDRYQKLIEEVRDELENAGQQQYAELIGRVPADVGDESVADALADFNAAMVDRQIHEIRDIEAARKRLKGGSYGVCTDCGDDIAFERLMAYPTAKRCFRCQQQREKTYAGEGRPSM
ncbi:MAG: TraR/DksA family transcriptional regulator [Pseudomonadota bacterium]